MHTTVTAAVANYSVPAALHRLMRQLEAEQVPKIGCCLCFCKFHTYCLLCPQSVVQSAGSAICTPDVAFCLQGKSLHQALHDYEVAIPFVFPSMPLIFVRPALIHTRASI